jgi:GNAT superfamily N-acetyltransferase
MMILLPQDNYYKVTEQLNAITINRLFALSVAKQHVTGWIYTDNIDTPHTFYVVHPYGMTLLAGSPDHDTFNDNLVNYLLNRDKTRNKTEWMQVFPDEWNIRLIDLLGDNLTKKKVRGIKKETEGIEIGGKIIENTRVNFRFDPVRYQVLRSNLELNQYQIVRTNRQIFNSMSGSVVPRYFWDNASQFLQRGIGFTLMQDGKPASTAYSAYFHPPLLELGIETLEAYRGRGFALYVCAVLIDYCLENGYEPVWSCRFENTASYMLAQKLGFEPILYIPYYMINC